MRFRFIEEHINCFPTKRLCHVVGGHSKRRLRAFCSSPASRRQRSDLVALAHIKEQLRLNLGRYGRPRMTEELKEIGWAVRNRMKRDLTIRSLGMDIAFRAPPKGCIYYPAGDYKVISREGITRIAGRNVVRTTTRKSCVRMASTTRIAVTQHWAGKVRSLLSKTPHK